MASDTPATPPPAGGEKWFYKTDEGKAGPLGREELLALFATGRLSPETTVWRHGMNAWQAAGELEEFVEAIQHGAGARLSVPSLEQAPWWKRDSIRLALLTGAMALLGAWVLGTAMFSGKASATVRGTVTADAKPVDGGTIVLSPVADGVAEPGKPGVADVSAAGEFIIRLEGGAAGIAKRARVQYVPPVLPPMSEEEARTAMPRYFGLVPAPATVAIQPGVNDVTIELVAGAAAK